MLEKKTFGKLLKNQRCLVLADGFYEWQKMGKQKQPYYFQLDSKELFAFPGLWDYESHDSSKILFSILTCPANGFVKEIHHRMPCILKPEQEDAWLADECSVESLSKLTKTFQETNLVYRSVNKAINSPKNDDGFLLENGFSHD